MKQSSSSSIIDFILAGWKFLANYEYASLGRVWIPFDSSIRMEVFSMSDQAVHCHTFSLA